MNGDVVDVISAGQSSGTYYGVVLSSERAASSSSTTTSDTTSVQVVTQVACTDGTERTFYHEGSTLRTGRVVQVAVDQSGTTVRSLSDTSLSGRVSSDGTTFAGYELAADVEILDTDGEGGYVSVYPSRIAGARLEEGDVRYYRLDANGDIDRLILEDVTGDTLDYVYVISASTSSGDMSTSGTYRYLLDGESLTLSGSVIYDISRGGAALLTDSSGSVELFQQLEDVDLTSVDDLTATANNRAYSLAEDVQVLLRDEVGDLYPTTLSEIQGGDYSLTGWYDDFDYAAGGRIRIIVAE